MKLILAINVAAYQSINTDSAISQSTTTALPRKTIDHEGNAAVNSTTKSKTTSIIYSFAPKETSNHESTAVDSAAKSKIASTYSAGPKETSSSPEIATVYSGPNLPTETITVFKTVYKCHSADDDIEDTLVEPTPTSVIDDFGPRERPTETSLQIDNPSLTIKIDFKPEETETPATVNVDYFFNPYDVMSEFYPKTTDLSRETLAFTYLDSNSIRSQFAALGLAILIVQMFI
jgi:hypothetical protein